MTTIDVRLRAQFGVFALDVAVSVPAKGVTVLFGPSGSGKTTVLRCIAGLTRATEANVSVRGACWEDSLGGRFVPTHKRGVAYVFQDPALLPHLTVRENIDYARRRTAKLGTSRIPLDALIDWLKLGALLQRRPAALSGGERQRVAIARALASEPVVSLMDEPLSSLDVSSRSEILPLLEHLHRELDVPVIYVTHSLDEVIRLADRIVWIDKGTIIGHGSVAEILARIDFASDLGDEAGSSIAAIVRRQDDAYHLTELDSAWGVLFTHRLEAQPGQSIHLHVRARDVSIALHAEERSSILNVLPAVVDAFEETSPGEVLLRLRCPGALDEALLARITRKSLEQLAVRVGDQVYARVKSVSMR